MHREEKPTRYQCKLYRIYGTLNMFRALLCPSSGALDYMYAIAAYGVHTAGSNSIHIVRSPDDGHRSARNLLSVS